MLLFVVILYTAFCIYHFTKNKTSIEEALVRGCVLVFLVIFVMTELLSLFSALTAFNIAACWLLYSIALSSVFVLKKNHNFIKLPRINWATVNVVDYLSLFYVLVTGLVAFNASPLDWDSLTYHLPRVMHWLQNNSVANYPAHITRQLSMAYLLEYFYVHIEALGSLDKSVNLVQWFFMLINCCLISMIADKFKFTYFQKSFARFFYLSLPMGILQASVVQMEHVVSFWVLALIYYGINYLEENKDSILVALTIALGFLTKSTFVIYSAPLILYGFFKLYKKTSIKKLIKSASLFLLFFVAINGHFFYKNYDFCGKILGPGQESVSDNLETKEGEYKYINDTINPKLFLSNIFRNAALQLGSFKNQQVIYDGVAFLHRKMNYPLNSSQSTWTGTEFKEKILSRDWATAGNQANALHFVLIIMAFFLVSRTRAYGFLVVLGALFFCALLKWQPWHARLHFTFFVMASIWVAPFANKKSKVLIILFSLLVTIANYRVLFYSHYHPLLTDDWMRTEWKKRSVLVREPLEDILYREYENRTKENEKLMSFEEEIKHFPLKKIGLILNGCSYVDHDDFEYILWQFFKKFNSNIEIRHIAVDNISSKYLNNKEYKNFRPTIIVATSKRDKEKIEYKAEFYYKYKTIAGYKFYINESLKTYLSQKG